LDEVTNNIREGVQLYFEDNETALRMKDYNNILTVMKMAI